MKMLRFAALLLMLLSGCAGLTSERFRPLDISIAGIELLDFGLFEQKFALTLRVQNPNNLAIELDGMNYRVEIDGEPFARGVAEPDRVIPKLGDALIRTEAISNLQSLARQLLEVKRGESKSIRYRIEGEFLIHGGRRFPFDTSGEVSLPELPSPRAKSIP